MKWRKLTKTKKKEMKTEEEKKREQRKHFWIGVGEALLPLLVGCIVGYTVAKVLMLANLI